MNKLSIICLVTAGLSSCTNSQTTQPKNEHVSNKSAHQPNIIILLTDDQGYGDMKCYGNQHLQTPNLDRLAAEGTRFTNFYAGAAASTPSRAALLTGRYAERVGVPGVVDDTSENGIKRSEITLAEYLKP